MKRNGTNRVLIPGSHQDEVAIAGAIKLGIELSKKITADIGDVVLFVPTKKSIRNTSLETVVRKYARSWLVEKGISEQIEFFHLNKLSSSMVIKVDFDLTMTILAHNIYRLLALEFGRYSSMSDQGIYEKFIANNGTITIEGENITIARKKKRELPQILETMGAYKKIKKKRLNNKKINYSKYYRYFSKMT